MKILKGWKKEIEAIQEGGDFWDILESADFLNMSSLERSRLSISSDSKHLPILSGGVDHIVVSKNQIEIHDIGCNGRDNSFILRK